MASQVRLGVGQRLPFRKLLRLPLSSGNLALLKAKEVIELKPFALVLCLLLAILAPLTHAGQVLRLGTNVWPGYEPLYLAAEHEAWPSRFNVRMVEYPSATEVLRAFRNRALEAAALTLDEVLLRQQLLLAPVDSDGLTGSDWLVD